MQQRAEVERGPIKSRQEVNPLTGIMQVEIKVCSKQDQDDAESYFHIGSGDIEISYERQKIENETRRITQHKKPITERDIEIMAELINIENYASFQKMEEPEDKEPALVIPGSSVKGNIRARIELTLAPRNGRAISCLTNQKILSSEPPRGAHGWRHYRIWKGSLSLFRGARCEATKSNKVCVVCNIFGAPGLGSRVNIGTFYAKPPAYTEKLEYRGERIIAAKPGTVFTGNIAFRGLSIDELGLLMLGMGQEPNGPRIVLMGKHKYAAFAEKLMGRILYNLVKVQISKDCAGEAGIKPGATYEGENLSELISTCLSSASQKYGEYIRVVDEHTEAIEVNKI